MQRVGVRLITFNKSGHTALNATFMTPPHQSIGGGKRNLQDETLRGGHGAAQVDWPIPVVNVAVLRNPLSRLYSAWNHLTQNHLYKPFGNIGLYQGMPWKDFLADMVVYLEKEPTPDPHVEPQMRAFKRLSDYRAENLFLRLENIDQGWSNMCLWYGLDCQHRPIVMNNTDYAAKTPWGEMYRDMPVELRHRYNRVFEDDLHHWHYCAI